MMISSSTSSTRRPGSSSGSSCGKHARPLRAASRGSSSTASHPQRQQRSSVVVAAAAAPQQQQLPPQLQAAVKQWLALDADPASRDAVQALAAAGNAGELQQLLGQRMEFGTAGLRAKMGPGYSRMNAVTIQQTTQGLLAYLQSQAPQQLAEHGVIIGFDARHNSREFAHIAAAVFASAGVKVALPGDFVPTPFVAAGVALLGCAAGVMVTASHNTKEYNGYKVYWGNGCQIIPPHDAGIAAAIEANLALQPLPALDVLPSGLVTDPTAAIAGSYYASLESHLRMRAAAQNAGAPRAVYTPLHGVGGPFAQRAFQVFGLPPPLLVEAQFQPDPEFSTVTFPNPEEGEGTWQMAFDTAAANDVQLVLANDPDADRLAAAEQVMDAGTGKGTGRFVTFSGNDIGLLLADWVWSNFKRKHPEVPPERCLMLASAVSSSALGSMAAVEGFKFEQTLTGFKWLGNIAQQRRAEGFTVLFAFEEAIGFMFPDIGLDKDGVAAAAAFAEMAAASEGSVAQRLEALYDKYGVHVSRASYYIADPPSKSQPVFDRLRQEGQYPQSVGGVRVTGVRDLGTGLDTTQPDSRAALPWTPGDLMLTLFLEGGGSLTLRASATEPKLKYYLEVKGSDRAAAEAAADAVEAAVGAVLVQPEASGLQTRG